MDTQVIDAIRTVVLVLLAVFMALFPFAMQIRHQLKQVILLVVAIELAYFSLAASVVDHFGDPFVWWLSPPQIIGTVVGIAAVYQMDKNAVKYEEEVRSRYGTRRQGQQGGPHGSAQFRSRQDS